MYVESIATTEIFYSRNGRHRNPSRILAVSFWWRGEQFVTVDIADCCKAVSCLEMISSNMSVGG